MSDKKKLSDQEELGVVGGTLWKKREPSVWYFKCPVCMTEKEVKSVHWPKPPHCTCGCVMVVEPKG